MAESGLMKLRVLAFSLVLVGSLLLFASSEEEVVEKLAISEVPMEEAELSLLRKAINFLWQKGRVGYTHVWPEMKFGWQIILGSLIGFFGASFGSVGGVGGGGIFVPMLTLIIGFDSKSSTAISKCMIMGAAASTVYYNLKQRHPTLEMPVIDYDLALLFQPMLVLGISIGVAFNVIFADWMITILLIILFIFTATKATLKGVETWNKETIMKKEAAKLLAAKENPGEGAEYQALPAGPEKREEVSLIENVHWKHVGILFAVWFAILACEIGQKHTTTCSVAFWVLNLLQVPVAIGASGYEGYMLYTGKRKIASRGDAGAAWKIHQLVFACFIGMCGGMVGGLLGLGGGFILGPLFLEMGIPPQGRIGIRPGNRQWLAKLQLVWYSFLRFGLRKLCTAN